MTPDETIVAVSSATGPAARAVVRLSGPRALAISADFFTPSLPAVAVRRFFRQGSLSLPGLHSLLPADLYAWPRPRSYTGQEVVELHFAGCGPLTEAVVGRLLAGGARAARPGEFTLRAFLAGKLDLTRAEAVLGVIEANDRDDLRRSLKQLAGGVARPLQELRDDLLNLLADVEAALDFADEDIQFVADDELLLRLGRAMALLTNLGRQFEERAVSGRPFRVVLAGPPNAGKSSLFNALLGRPAALVGEEAGTTRDYLEAILEIGNTRVTLIDTAGWQPPRDEIEKQAQELGERERGEADLILDCVEAGAVAEEFPSAVPMLRVATKCDRGRAPAGTLPTSALRGVGLDRLRQALADEVTRRSKPSLAPSVSRCRHHIEECLKRLRLAHHIALFREPPELMALELRLSLDHLGEMAGAVYTDDLLDRIFSRFCIGK